MAPSPVSPTRSGREKTPPAAASATTTTTIEPHLQDDHTSHPPTPGITEICDSDVLCGRGGAALRHPGNQTYRRLVNLNKGLYTTCLKTEKLKISRSIVAAIREQQGRFLEKESETSWYDIGDKKAIEKTSQALREGQPKLRQKIVEMGGVAAMESQYGHPGLYPEQVGLVADPTLIQMPPPPPVMMNQQQQHPLHQMHVQNQVQQVAVAAAQNAVLRQGRQGQQELLNGSSSSLQQQPLPHPDARQISMHEDLFQRMSLRELQAQQEEQQLQQQQYDRSQIQHPHLQSQQQIYQQQQLYQQQLQQQQQLHNSQSQLHNSQSHLHNSQSHLHNPQSQLLGPPPKEQLSDPQQLTSTSELSLLSNFSASMNPDERTVLGMDNNNLNAGGSSMLPSSQQPVPSGPIGSEYYQQQAQQSVGNFDDNDDMNISEHQHHQQHGHHSSSNRLEDKLAQDRRRVYARMKYNPGEQYSNPSSMAAANTKTSSQQLPANSNHSMGDGMPDFHMLESSLSLYSNLSTMTDGKSEHFYKGSLANHFRQASSQQPETVKVIDHSTLGGGGGNRLDRGSGHSLMSVSSIDSNLFSDFKRGISTHSMGEISILHKMERAAHEEDDTDGFSNRLDEGGAIL